jgi:uncharacterized protein (DUF433 family)
MSDIEPRTDLIRIDPEIMGGTPCIAGTRITVYAIAARFNGGETVEELIADWPYITRAAVEASIAYAARIPFAEDPDGRPWRKAKPKAEAA